MRKLRCFFVAVLALFMLAGNVSAAGTSKSYKFTYYVDNESARDLVTEVNDWRTGGEAWFLDDEGNKTQAGKMKALTYDYDLEQIALQRAYEVAIKFSLKRLNGSYWNTCQYGNTKSRGEERAHGESTAAAILVQMQRLESYGRPNILDQSFSAIGAAHVVLDGEDFWVLEFGFENSGAAATNALVGTKTVSLSVDTSNYYFWINITEEIPTLGLGSTVPLPEVICSLKPSGAMCYSNGVVIPKDQLKDFKWNSSSSTVLRINDDNTITAVKAGQAALTVSVTYEGTTYTSKTTLYVNVSKIDINDPAIKCSVPECYYSIGTVHPEPKLTYNGTVLKAGTDYEITGYSDNQDVTTNAVIHIMGKGNFTGNRDITFKISKRDINDCDIVELSDAEYTGSTVTPKIRITVNGMELTKGKHYKLSTDSYLPGTRKLTITGIGSFTGTRTVSFKIKKKSVSSLTIDPIPDQIFTGSEIKPSVTVKHGSIELVENKDYTLTYSNNTNVTSDASVVITGKGNYTGTKTIKFSIVTAADFTWKNDSGKWYLYDREGNMLTGWQQVNGKWYFLNDDGVMATGWLCRGEFWYYLEPSGAMVTGWKQIGSIWYYFENSGVMKTGWLNSGNIWYYLNSDGAMVTGWKQIGGIWYYFASSGAMKTGWQYIGSSWYYFESSGAMKTGWLCSGGNWYYLQESGSMATKWLEIKDKWYWFGTDGIMVYSTSIEIDGKTYNFDENGVCTNH